MKHLEIKEIVKKYDGKPVVSNVSFDMNLGEFISILGKSGSGKTTILKMIAGTMEPDGGEIYLLGKEISKVQTQKRNITMVFQEYLLFPHLNVAQNIEFSLKVKGVDKRERTKRMFELLELVQLGGMEKRFPHELSGGQKQRVAVARALISKPDVLLLDEPFSSLDFNLRNEMCGFIKNVQRETKTTTIMVTHDREEAMKISDRIAIIDEGVMVQIDTPIGLYNNPINMFAAEFMGDINVLKKEGEFSYIIRPEAIGISSFIKEGFDKATVCEKTFLGSSVNYKILWSSSFLNISRLNNNEEYSIGQEIYIRIPAKKVIKVKHC